MSHQRHGSWSTDKANHPETLRDNAVSCNECSSDLVWIDSESCGNSRYPNKASVLGGTWPSERAAIIARFWAKVHKTDTCWLWTGSVTGSARIKYGQFHIGRLRGKVLNVAAHRLSWELAHGPVPDDLQLCHRCDVPRCVRPDHLFLGTQADNLTDARQKGRLIDGAHAIRVPADAVTAIRTAYRPGRGGNVAELAARYHVTPASIHRLAQGVQQPRIGSSQLGLGASDAMHRVFERVPHVSITVVGDVR